MVGRSVLFLNRRLFNIDGHESEYLEYFWHSAETRRYKLQSTYANYASMGTIVEENHKWSVIFL